jgi:RNA methyltransferase, TrmH family
VRRSEGAFVVEGVKLLAAALDCGATVESVYVASGAQSVPAVAELMERALDSGSRLFELAPDVLEKVADTVTPQPVLAIVAMPHAVLDDLVGATFVVVCADVRDPGNAGAVIRCAEAAGADAVICCEGTVDPFNPKTVRASAGSVLHLPVIVGGDAAEVLATLGSAGLMRLAALAHGGTPLSEVDVTGPLALVLGNEATGLPPSLSGRLDGAVTIPMTGRVESLNVSTAAAVLCFEVLRRRSNLQPVPESR